jgi:hypothetical protein
MGRSLLRTLSDVERAVYDLVLGAGELMAKDVPFKMAGSIPRLIRKGLLEAYKRPVEPGCRKKQTFLRCREQE